MALLLAITFIQVRGTKPPATLKDHPIAAGEPIYLDGAWTLASSALEDTPSPLLAAPKRQGVAFKTGLTGSQRLGRTAAIQYPRRLLRRAALRAPRTAKGVITMGATLQCFL